MGKGKPLKIQGDRGNVSFSIDRSPEKLTIDSELSFFVGFSIPPNLWYDFESNESTMLLHFG
jgi:hypothetical protein